MNETRTRRIQLAQIALLLAAIAAMLLIPITREALATTASGTVEFFAQLPSQVFTGLVHALNWIF